MFELFAFNVAIANLMELTNSLEKHLNASFCRDYRDSLRSLIIMMSPITPHLAAEMWSTLRSAEGECNPSELDVFNQCWPQYDETQLQWKTRPIAVQLNGKLKGVLHIPVDALDSEHSIRKFVESSSIYHRLLKELTSQRLEISRVIVARERVINYVTNQVQVCL